MIKKIFSFLLIIVFFSLLGGVVFLHSDGTKRQISRFLQDWLEKETGYQLEIGQLAFTPPYEVRATQLTIKHQNQPLVKFDRATIQISPLALLKKQLYFPYIFLEGSIEGKPLQVEGEFSVQETGTTGIVILNQQIKLALQYQNNQAEFYLKQLQAASFLRGTAAFNKGKGAILKITDGKVGPLFVSGRLALTPQGCFDGSYLTVNSQSLPYPFSGSIHGKAIFSGLVESPRLNFTLDSDEFSLWRNRFHNGHLVIDAQWQHQGLLGSMVLSFKKEDQPYHFQGSLNQVQKGEYSALKLFSSFQLEQLLLLADIDAPDTSANVDFELIAPTNGNVEYQVNIREGHFEIYDYGVSIEQLQATLNGNLKKFYLHQLQGVTNNGGMITGHGELSLDPQREFPYLVHLKIHEMSFPNLLHWQALWNGDMTVTGNFQEALLQGTLKTTQGFFNVEYSQPDEIESIEVFYINQPPQHLPPTSVIVNTISFPLKLDVHLEAPEGIRIFGSEMDSDWSGNIHFKGTIAEPLVYGTMNLDKGFFEAGAKTFKMRRGTVTVDGDQKKAMIFLSSGVEIDRISIEVIAKGPLNNPTLSLHSSPPMSQREILSWLIFNQGIEDIDPLQREELPFSFTDLKSTSNSPDILTRIKKRTGLDVLSIKQSAESDPGKASLKIGKYISQGTLVTISHDVNNIEGSKSAQCVGIETSFSKEFKVQAQIDDESNGHLNLIWKKDY